MIKKYFLALGILGAFLFLTSLGANPKQDRFILPTLPKNIEQQLYDSGVIDKSKFSGELSMLNLFWAFGLANKNEILEKGPMVDKKYGGDAGNFASTGGWTLAVGNPMNHYNHHAFIALTPEQQKLVEEVSKNIYRPCCGNSVYFPDCNHGMAMLGWLELMAVQNVSEEDMYKAALAVNSYWFPDMYLNIAQYLKINKIDWKRVSPKEILGANFSSASGYQQILKQIQPATNGKGSSCGV